MAEEEKAEGAAEVKTGNKKLIIIIVVVALVVVAASVGFTLYLLNGSDDSGSDPVVAEVEKPRQTAMYLDLKPAIIVTYSYKGKQRFIQASLNLMARDRAVLDAAELHGPVIRNRLINLYGGKDFESIQTHEGRIGLLDETRTTINSILQEQKVEGEVEAVLFQNLVLQ